MASVSAVVLIGSSHQNDNGFSPDWIAELWEGDRATWVFRPQTGNRRVRRFHPASTAKIFDAFRSALVRIIGTPVDDAEEPRQLTLVVVILDKSSLKASLAKFKALKGLDVHLAPTAWSRVWDGWRGEWKLEE